MSLVLFSLGADHAALSCLLRLTNMLLGGGLAACYFCMHNVDLVNRIAIVLKVTDSTDGVH